MPIYPFLQRKSLINKAVSINIVSWAPGQRLCSRTRPTNKTPAGLVLTPSPQGSSSPAQLWNGHWMI